MPTCDVAVTLPSGPGRLELYRSLAEAESVWRALEGDGVMSPYQRFDWVQAYQQAAGAPEQGVVVLRSDMGEPLLLLPLEVRRRAGLGVASLPGGKHANFQLPVFARGAPPLAGDGGWLAAAGVLLGVDAFAFGNVPAAWEGEANPLLLRAHARANPSNAFVRTLDPDPETTLAAAFGRETRKKLRKKERLLAERGALDFAQAATEAAVEAVLDAFFDQKSARMRQLGVADPFSDPAMRDFLRRAACAGLAQGRPAIELYALTLDGDIVATFGGAGDAGRLCGMVNSFDQSPDLERCSPGEVLLARLIRLQCERGRHAFDLGVGEARYKSALCDEVEGLYDVVVPVTLRGRAYAAAAGRLVSLKRTVKRHPMAWRLAQTGRALGAALTRRRA